SEILFSLFLSMRTSRICSSVFHWKCSNSSAASTLIEIARLRGVSYFSQSLLSLNSDTCFLSIPTVVSSSMPNGTHSRANLSYYVKDYSTSSRGRRCCKNGQGIALSEKRYVNWWICNCLGLLLMVLGSLR